jgi:hypothetical protein
MRNNSICLPRAYYQAGWFFFLLLFFKFTKIYPSVQSMVLGLTVASASSFLNYRILGPTSHLLKWNLHLNKIPRWFIITLNLRQTELKDMWLVLKAWQQHQALSFLEQLLYNRCYTKLFTHLIYSLQYQCNTKAI